MHSDSLKMTVGNLKKKTFFVLVHVIIANIRIFISFSAYAPLDLLLFFLWSAHLFHMFYFITGFFLAEVFSLSSLIHLLAGYEIFYFYSISLWGSFLKTLWWLDLGWAPGAHQATLSFPSSAGQGRGENKIEENLMCQDKGSLIKQ